MFLLLIFNVFYVFYSFITLYILLRVLLVGAYLTNKYFPNYGFDPIQPDTGLYACL